MKCSGSTEVSLRICVKIASCVSLAGKRLALEGPSQEALTLCPCWVSWGGKDPAVCSPCHPQHPEGLLLCQKTDLLGPIHSWESKETYCAELPIS